MKARDELFKKIAAASTPSPPISVSRAASSGSGRAGHVLERRLPQAGHRRPFQRPALTRPGSSSVGVCGCQFAEVAVDIETGMVKVKKIVAVQDSGLILDKLTWESQVYGGVIGG